MPARPLYLLGTAAHEEHIRLHDCGRRRVQQLAGAMIKTTKAMTHQG